MPTSNFVEFERFRFFVLPSNTRDAVNIPISNDPNNPTVVASLSIHADCDDVVWLTAAVGWNFPAGEFEETTPVLFKIWRGDPVTGTLVYSALEEAENAVFSNIKLTSLSHVDSGFTESRDYRYVLTAEVTNPNPAIITGPITFTAAEIDSTNCHCCCRP